MISALPRDQAAKSSHVALVVTKHGGHIGFLEGIFPRNAGYVDRLFAQFIETIFERGDALREMSSEGTR